MFSLLDRAILSSPVRIEVKVVNCIVIQKILLYFETKSKQYLSSEIANQHRFITDSRSAFLL